MGGRKFRKRSRQKARSDDVQRSLRQHARSLKRRQYESKSTKSTPDPRKSPELVLFESQRADPLYDNNARSPEIVPKSSRIKFEAEASASNARIGDDTQKTEPSKRRSSTRDFNGAAECPGLLGLEDCSKHDISELIIDDTLDSTATLSSGSSLSLNTSLENQAADVTQDIERSAASAFDKKFDLSAMFPSDLDEIRQTANPGQQCSQDGSARDEETTSDYPLMDKTLSMNDELTREMNNYLDERTSTTIIGHSTLRTSPSRPTRFAAFCKSGKWSESAADGVGLSLDEFQLAGTSVCEPVDERNESRDNHDRSLLDNNNNGRSNVVLGTIGKHLTVNWRELRKHFARLDKRIHEDEEDAKRDRASLLSRYRWFIEDRRFPYVSISTSSSFGGTPSSKSARDCGSLKLVDCTDVNDPRRYVLAESNARGREKTECTIQNSRFLASCSREYLSAKQCQAILTYENEHEAAGKERRPMTARVRIPFPPSTGKWKSMKPPFPLNQLSCNKTGRDNRSSESMSTSDLLDQLAVADYDSLQEVIVMVINP